MSTAKKRLAPEDRSEFLTEVADRFGVSNDRLTILVEAAQILSRAEFKVAESLLELAESGVSLERRSAICQGILRAIRMSQDANGAS
jgi:hypothetical protein